MPRSQIDTHNFDDDDEKTTTPCSLVPVCRDNALERLCVRNLCTTRVSADARPYTNLIDIGNGDQLIGKVRLMAARLQQCTIVGRIASRRLLRLLWLLLLLRLAAAVCICRCRRTAVSLRYGATVLAGARIVARIADGHSVCFVRVDGVKRVARMRERGISTGAACRSPAKLSCV